MRKFLIIIEQTNTEYSAYVPDLPGCIATGKTEFETEANIYEAITFHLEGLKEEGLEIPESKSEAEVLLIAGQSSVINTTYAKVAKPPASVAAAAYFHPPLGRQNTKPGPAYRHAA